MSILQMCRRPPRGPGLVVNSRFRELSEKPGYLSLKDGSQELRNLYVDGLFSFPSFFFSSIFFNLEYLFFFFWLGSVAQEPSLFSDFGLACFLGLYEEVKKACLSCFFWYEFGL